MSCFRGCWLPERPLRRSQAYRRTLRLFPSYPAFLPSQPARFALDQYGMEYNPVAINEALMYSFQISGAATPSNRFAIELVNTLTMPELPTPVTADTAVTNASVLDLGGFGPSAAPAAPTLSDPYSMGSWDIVFTGDDPYSRPDPIRGELPIYGNIYGLTPLNQSSFSTTYPHRRGRALPSARTSFFNRCFPRPRRPSVARQRHSRLMRIVFGGGRAPACHARFQRARPPVMDSRRQP